MTAQRSLSSCYPKTASFQKHAVLGCVATCLYETPCVREATPVRLGTNHMVGEVTLEVSRIDMGL